MSWGTSYKYDGYIIRVAINELESKLADTKDELEDSRDELLALMAMSPPASGSIEHEGEKMAWDEYVKCRLDRIWDDIEMHMYQSVVLEQAIEVKHSNPENLSEG